MHFFEFEEKKQMRPSDLKCTGKPVHSQLRERTDQKCVLFVVGTKVISEKEWALRAYHFDVYAAVVPKEAGKENWPVATLRLPERPAFELLDVVAPGLVEVSRHSYFASRREELHVDFRRADVGEPNHCVVVGDVWKRF